jgi:hypothetical protein
MALPRVASLASLLAAGGFPGLSDTGAHDTLAACHAGRNPMLMRTLTMLFTWLATAVLLWWPRLAGPERRKLALLSSGAGLLALILAMGAEGFRESPTVAVFLLGTPYVTEKASASAGLPYYVLTGVFLTLGFVGLALGDPEARAIGRHWLLGAIGLGWLATALRFLLEKVAAPAAWTQAVGVTWMAPVAGAFFWMCLRSEGRGIKALLASLVAYAYAVRGAVALLMVVATSLRLGSHYDVSPLVLVYNPVTGRPYSFVAGSLEQIVNVSLIPQLVVWPIYTVLAGLLGALVARVIVLSASSGVEGPSSVPPAEAAPARSD